SRAAVETPKSGRLCLNGKVKREAGRAWRERAELFSLHPPRSTRHRSFLPPHETFEGLKLGQAKFVVEPGRVPGPIPRPVPKLAAVDPSREHRPILLGMGAENRHFFPLHVVGTERNRPFDFVRLPFFPGAPVEPDLEGRYVPA